MKKALLIFFLMFLFNSLYSQNLYINEFMASNDTSYYDATTDNYPDWIEIYNAGTEAVDIGGMYITDDLEDLTHWQIPTTAPDSTTIPAGGFLLLIADKKTEAGVLHVNIKLSGGGEQIGLTMSDGVTILDSLTFGEQTTDISYGRNPDGSNSWDYFINGTPGNTNADGTVVGVDENENIPNKFSLSQNYPNPFSKGAGANPTTTISYSLSKAGNVQIVVYNLLGQKIATLVNARQAPGNYNISFNAKNLSVGTYFYTLRVGDFVSTKKMVLLK